jgi:hypothetical protein
VKAASLITATKGIIFWQEVSIEVLLLLVARFIIKKRRKDGAYSTLQTVLIVLLIFAL